jgi:acyl-CoA reductase-like NAD-dependent aldehyde dehydrogenase
LYIDGAFVDSGSTDFLDVIDPATTETIGRVPDASEADVARAVSAARRALDGGGW